MKTQSLVERLKKFMKSRSEVWINGGDLERLALTNGYKASNISRRCRELVESNELERRENEKGHVEYKWKKREVVKSVYEIQDGKVIYKQETLFV